MKAHKLLVLLLSSFLVVSCNSPSSSDSIDNGTTSTDEYSSLSIKEAREKEKGYKVIVEGVVGRITYAYGLKPNGFYLIDSTSSIYVFDSNVASKVNIGNSIRLAGEKDFWILESEITYAEKYGYQGSNQLINCSLLSNDNKINDFDTSWVEKSTVKKMLNTPFSENITNKIYKVDSYVKKQVGTGFVNYYFDDIDGVTGSYTYTQCNGSDFSWIDEFNNKICTVYLACINAKSTSSSAFYRFMPIKIIDENYSFDKSKIGEYVYEYRVKDLFSSIYNGDPKLEVPTSVSSSLLGFENAEISYSSSDEDVASFLTEEGKTIFHINSKEGKADVVVTISYPGNEDYKASFSVSYIKQEASDYSDVKTAIDAEINSQVRVRGIAGPSLIHSSRKGFYLVDDSGLIALQLDADAMKDISFGDDIVVSGVRSKAGKNKNYQDVILDGKVEVNLKGGHEYSTASFIKDKSLNELLTDASLETVNFAQGYIVNAKIEKEETTYYTNYYLNDGGLENLLLYASNGKSQYGWLDDFGDGVLSFEIALCSWSDKVSGVILAVIKDGVKTINKKSYN